ncbi:MAG TPA: S-layer homology domain-containing protein [Symbiobacteriaceae bacterium]|nr:S-layer homology domain-containing protein [Symbiobacteriaceae bacterium]
MKRKQRGVLAAGMLVVSLMVARPASGLLVDMAGHWSGPIIGALQARGIIAGGEQGQFDPELPLTRAQLAKLLVTGLGYQEEATLLSQYPSRFSDVVRWHWAKGFVEALAESALVEGYPDGRFGPEETVTRSQLAAILVRSVGLVDQARLYRFDRTNYVDDAQIPDWARGYVAVAQRAGLMSGFEDGTFRPEQPISRSEGGVAIFRLLSLKGRVFDLTGTLMRFDPATLQGTVRDALGQEQPFTMAAKAEYFRAGAPSAAAQLRVLDQVWVVLGPDGKGTFLDARYDELLTANPQVQGQTLTITLPGNGRRTLPVQPGAPIFLNGQPVPTLDRVQGAGALYLVLDRVSGDVRAVDAVTVHVAGRLLSTDAEKVFYVVTGSETKIIKSVPEIIVVLNGQRVQVSDLKSGDQVKLVLNENGAITYVVAER